MICVKAGGENVDAATGEVVQQGMFILHIILTVNIYFTYKQHVKRDIYFLCQFCCCYFLLTTNCVSDMLVGFRRLQPNRKFSKIFLTLYTFKKWSNVLLFCFVLLGCWVEVCWCFCAWILGHSCNRRFF